MPDPTIAPLAPDLDELTQLELHIARRADQLSRESATTPLGDCWFQAEREFWRAWFASEQSQLAG